MTSNRMSLSDKLIVAGIIALILLAFIGVLRGHAEELAGNGDYVTAALMGNQGGCGMQGIATCRVLTGGMDAAGVRFVKLACTYYTVPARINTGRAYYASGTNLRVTGCIALSPDGLRADRLIGPFSFRKVR